MYSAQEAAGQLIRQSDLKDSIVNSAKIVDGSIATGDLADSLITTAKINADAVTGAKIADDQINSEHYVDASIDTQHIADSQITTAKIADSNVTTAKIADSNVTTAKIAADAITGAKIADDQINSEHYVDGSIDTAHIADSQITSAKIADGTIVAGDLASNSVTTAKITDANVTTAKIADANVTQAKLSANAVATANIADNQVTTAKIVNSNITTAKIAADNITSALIADDQIDSEHYVDGSIDTAHIGGAQVTDAKLASNSVTTNKITDANVTTVKVADSNITLAKLASDLKQTSISDSDTQLPTSGAVVDYVAAQLQPFGGFEAVATEVAFPNTQPVSGVAISISDAGGVVINGSGVSTTGRTVGGSTVTINGFPSSLYNETLVAGVGLIVTSTRSSQTYNYHKILGKEDDIKQLSDDINDFNARYRVGSSNPTSALDSGDLFFNTGSGKLLVYNGTQSAWEEAQSIGQYFINTISSYSGTGGNSASFNGSAYRFVMSNPGATAEQHIVSVNGVVQKPNSGTSQPSEGFAIDGSSIIFSSAPPSSADFFIITIGSAVNIGTPSNATVSTDKLTSGAVTTVKIADDAVTGAKIADNLDIPDNNKIRFGTGNDLQIFHDGSNSFINEVGTGGLYVRSQNTFNLQKAGTSEYMLKATTDGSVELYHDNAKKLETTSSGAKITGVLEGDSNLLLKTGSGNNSVILKSNNELETLLQATVNGAVELYHDNSKKFETSANGVDVTGNLFMPDSTTGDTGRIKLGDQEDLQIYHTGSQATVDSNTGDLYLRADGSIYLQTNDSESAISCTTNGAVELYHDNEKKLNTTAGGVLVTGDFATTGSGGTITANEHLKIPNDTGKLYLGASNDLEIYHDGTNSILQNNTGVFYLKTINGEFSLVARPNGATELYHDHSKKLETTSSGATITGTCTATAFAGDGSALTGIQGIPSGVIMLWSGAANAIPSGFVICDGGNSTPDLRDRFVVGAGSSYGVDDTGGAASVTLTVNQIPSHSHTLNRGTSTSSTPNAAGRSVHTANAGSTGSTGGGQSHENRPPYYALCYIMKT